MNKNLLVIAISLLSVLGANAQIEKGKVLVGGSTNLSFTNSTATPSYDGEAFEDFKVTVSQFQIAPQIGYFVIDGLAIGIDLNYSSAKGKIGDGDWSDPSTSMGVGLFGKYYIGSTNFKPFVQATLGFMSMSDGDDDDDKYSGLALGGVLGAAYFLNENIALEFGLGYNMANMKNKADEKDVMKGSEFGFKVGFAISL